MNKCVFCGIVEGSVPSKMLYEDERLFIVNDIKPWARVHLLAIPKEHIPSMIETTADHERLLGKLLSTLREAARRLGIASSGYRVIINNGRDSQQEVHHLHVHLIGGEKLPPTITKSNN